MSHFTAGTLKEIIATFSAAADLLEDIERKNLSLPLDTHKRLAKLEEMLTKTSQPGHAHFQLRWALNDLQKGIVNGSCV